MVEVKLASASSGCLGAARCAPERLIESRRFCRRVALSSFMRSAPCCWSSSALMFKKRRPRRSKSMCRCMRCSLAPRAMRRSRAARSVECCRPSWRSARTRRCSCSEESRRCSSASSRRLWRRASAALPYARLLARRSSTTRNSKSWRLERGRCGGASWMAARMDSSSSAWRARICSTEVRACCWKVATLSFQNLTSWLYSSS
mmetsp:Transcript_22501/g.66306  ORF Transcript_22501/g.66306 Transcript_22501/m.66306 type:complete len:203 (-) Transcript_22501:1143-1751(-)